MRRVWVSMLVLMLSACPASEAHDGGVVEDAGTGQLLLVFDGDFGEVERFTTAANPARFINVGTVAASVSRLSVEGDGFSIGDYDESPIAPGAAREIPVNFRPTRNGPHTARISFQSTTLPVLATFSMQGTGVGALVKVNDELELGAHLISDFQTLRVDGVLRIENVGDRWLYFPSALPWVLSPAEELCIGDIDAFGACLGSVRNVDVTAGVAPGRTLEVPVHFVSTVPGERRWTITVKTSLPDAPLLEVPVRIKVTPLPTCRLVADETMLDFGDVEPLRARDMSFTLRNDGTASCTALMPGLVATSDFAIIEPREWPRTLQPGERVEVTARSQPAVESGPVTGFVNIGSVVVQLRVNAVERQCVLVTAPDSLGAWSPGCAPRQGTLRFKNRCTTPVQVPVLTTSSSEQFSVSTGFPLPRTILEDTSLEAVLSPSATSSEGEYRTTWNLQVQTDFGAEVHRRQVRAQVVSGVAKERQRPLEKVDVLVVYDKAMTSLDTTRTELASLYSRLLSTGVDFRLGLINSNANDGRLISVSSGNRWMSPVFGSDTAFLSLIAGPSTSGDGPGVNSLLRAMTVPMATDPSANQGFFRADASLVVVMISSSTPSFADDAEQLLAFKPGVRDFVVHATTCTSTFVSPELRKLVETTGGTLANCATPWTGFVNDVVSSVRGRRKRMLINSEVAPNTLTVNGVSASAWSYVEPWLSIPEGRTTIEAQFMPLCR